MPIPIKSTADIAAKFQDVTPGRTSQYRDGVSNPKKSWETETKAAEGNYKTAVTKAAAEGRFGRGVAKAGDSKWQARTLLVGPGRFAEGVATAGPAYADGFGPYRDVIAGTTLPPRGPTGDPRNIDRVRVIAENLHKKKLAG